jgi:hypothetical protein
LSKGIGVVGRVCGGGMAGGRGCVGGAVRASAGSRRWSCACSGAGYPKTFVRRTSAFFWRAQAPAGAVARATNRGVVVLEPGCSGRLASGNGIFEGLARVGEPAGVEPALRAPGDVDDLGCLSALATLERFTDRWPATVVVGRLDHQPAGVGGPGLRDRSEPTLRAAGVLARDDPDVGGELVSDDRTVPIRRSPRTAPARIACRSPAGSATARPCRRTGRSMRPSRAPPRPDRGDRSARHGHADSPQMSPSMPDRRTGPSSTTRDACASTPSRTRPNRSRGATRTSRSGGGRASNPRGCLRGSEPDRAAAHSPSTGS